MSKKGLFASICLIVLHGLEVNGSEIGFRVKDWDPLEEYLNKPLAVVQVDRQLNARQLTFCFRFQIYGSFGKQIGLSDSNNFLKFGVWFRFQDNYGFVFLNEKALIFNIPKGIMRPYSWYYFCFSINDTHYVVVVNGKVWLENEIPSKFNPSTLMLNKLVTVGSGPRGKQKYFIDLPYLKILFDFFVLAH